MSACPIFPSRIHCRAWRTAGKHRVHMASIGWPLLGDFLYGQEEPDVIGRTALHSWHLSFLHPVTGGKLEFTTPPPADFTALFPHYRYPDPATLDFGKDTSC